MSLLIGKLTNVHNTIFGWVERALEGWALGLLARLVFSSVTLFFFWNSARTKVGDSIFSPSTGAYAQIFPKKFEAVGYDSDALSYLDTLIVLFGTYAEFLLPLLILIGLFTRLSSAAMIGFIVVMSIVDVSGHGADAKTIGMVFDRIQDGVILDQRLLWLFPLIYLIVKGAGAISVDGLLAKRQQAL